MPGSDSQSLLSLLPAQSLPRHRHRAGGSRTQFPGSQGPCAQRGEHQLRPTEQRRPLESSSLVQEAAARGQEAMLPDPCLFSRALVMGPFPWALALT